MNEWSRIEPTIATKIDYHHAIVKTFKLPDGQIATRTTFLAENRRAAGVIAVTDDGKVIVGKQFRPGPERVFEEIPGGYVDEGEDPQDAAIRELQEETGYAPSDVEFLGSFSRDAYMNGTWYYYLATGCKPTTERKLDHDEFIELEFRSIEEFIQSAKEGNMTDPVAVLAAHDRLREIQSAEARDG